MLILVADCYGRMIQFPLGEDLDEIAVGSLPENQICLPYKGVSRRHFALVRNSKGWLLKDLGSTNGTKLNGALVKETIVHPQDVIQAGTIEMRLIDSSKENIIALPETQTKPVERYETDKVSDIEHQWGPGYQSTKLVFPGGMIPAASVKMMEIYRQIDSLVDSDVGVLLTGETGTGKEMLARMLHLSGKRAHGNFVAMNCAAIPSELVEAELFGIGEKVATNVSRREGKMVLAHKGSLFLDELEAFPMAMQAKVLRAIEEKSVTPVGLNQAVAADFRLITATNEDPADLIQAGKLREDLYHRIAAVEIVVPPLRERKEDLPLLIIGLLQQIVRKEKKPIAGVSKKLFSLLCDYTYPGNVRELLNLLNSMVALAHPGEVLDMHLAPGKLLQVKSFNRTVEETDTDLAEDEIDLHGKLDEMSKRLILQALERHSSNLSAAARSLRISPFGLRKMMKRLSISPKKTSNKD